MTSSRTWLTVAKYLSGFAMYYPGIDDWASRIRSGVPMGTRSVFAFISSDGDIAGLAVTKNEEYAKLCHISVADVARSDGLGALLMYAAVAEMLAAGARGIHVTTGEEVASDFGAFFERCGFRTQSVWRSRYRRGFDELEWVASRETMSSRLFSLWNSVQRRSIYDQARPCLMRLTWVSRIGELTWAPVMRERPGISHLRGVTSA